MCVPPAAHRSAQALTPPAAQMTQLILHVIAEEDMWPTRVVLPIRLTESEMEIQWDEYVFNNHLLGA
jgi:hypothetical protein